jgi:putative FmdB family regulatory protein
MPTYHYKCKACNHEFEEFQGMSEDPLVKCPSCGKRKLVLVISGSGLVFKGSGFYLTDYKKQGSSIPEGSKEKKDSGGAEKDTKSPPAGKKTKAKGESSPGPQSGDKA